MKSQAEMSARDRALAGLSRLMVNFLKAQFPNGKYNK